ncbi:Fungal specific transcription factor domain-containing protein [Cladophialophora immunda]|nr:Fungal specific transcription factor domain-containing protein [Cladophialophora immunda]
MVPIPSWCFYVARNFDILADTISQTALAAHNIFRSPHSIREETMHFDPQLPQETSLENIPSSMHSTALNQNRDNITELRASDTPWSWFNWESDLPFDLPHAEVLFNDLGDSADISNNDSIPSGREEGNEVQTSVYLHNDPADLFGTVLRVLDTLDSPEHKSLLLDVPKRSDTDMLKFWNQYFEGFHKRFPVIHRASTQIWESPPLLVSVVTAIGASYSPEPGATEYYVRVFARICMILSCKSCGSQGIHKLCDPLTLLLCQCLVYFFIVIDSSGIFRPWALAGQACMVATARSASVFYSNQGLNDDSGVGIAPSPSDLSTVDCSLSPQELLDQDLEGTVIHRQWLEWIAAEKRKRLGWAVVAIHSLYHLRTQSPFRLSFAELDLYLPYDEKMWEATDATSWRRQFPWTDRPPRTLPLLGAVRTHSENSSSMTDLSSLAILAMGSLVELVHRGKRRRVLGIQSPLKSEAARKRGWHLLVDEILEAVQGETRSSCSRPD